MSAALRVTLAELEAMLDFPSDLKLRDGREGRLGGIFPPESEVEVMVRVERPWQCSDGTHVAACSGFVLHEHRFDTDRVSASMLDVVELNGQPIEVVA